MQRIQRNRALLLEMRPTASSLFAPVFYDLFLFASESRRQKQPVKKLPQTKARANQKACQGGDPLTNLGSAANRATLQTRVSSRQFWIHRGCSSKTPDPEGKSLVLRLVVFDVECKVQDLKDMLLRHFEGASGFSFQRARECGSVRCCAGPKIVGF